MAIDMNRTTIALPGSLGLPTKMRAITSSSASPAQATGRPPL